VLPQGRAVCWAVKCWRSSHLAQGGRGKRLQGRPGQVRQPALLLLYNTFLACCSSPWLSTCVYLYTTAALQEGGPQGEAEGGCRPDQVLWPGPAGMCSQTQHPWTGVCNCGLVRSLFWFTKSAADRVGCVKQLLACVCAPPGVQEERLQHARGLHHPKRPQPPGGCLWALQQPVGAGRSLLAAGV
jgi:hypothetical protein